MNTVGIDIGSTSAKYVVLDGNKTIVAKGILPTGWSSSDAASQIRHELANWGFDVTRLPTVATGYGRLNVPYSDKNITEISCHALGAVNLFGYKNMTLIDIGGQDTKIISIKDGMVENFLMNDKCSAGTGRFLEVMANAMQLDPISLSELAKKGKSVSISSMCTVFAESEVISLIGKGTAREDIAFGIIDSIASKVKSQCGKLGAGGNYYLSGGLCECKNLIEILSEKLGAPVRTCPDARYAGALGAALSARKVQTTKTEKTLPELFESFAEARKDGFLAVRKRKENGTKIAGTFCTFTPQEVFDAAGICTVSLCGTSQETIPDAETVLPKNLCPLIKSSYGFAMTDKCPYTYFSDIIIGETTCDGKKKMYEQLGEFKDVYVMQLPQGADRLYAEKLWTNEVRCLIEMLEDKFGVTITDESLRQASVMRNAARKARCDLMEMQRLIPPPMTGLEIYRLMEGGKFKFDVESSTEEIRRIVSEISERYEAGERPVPATAKRILITGCPIGGVLEKTVGVIESNGGVCVCFENCGGIKPVRRMIDTEADDIVRAIASRYLDIGCAVMSPNLKRMEMLPELFKEFQVDGVVDIILQTCHPYSVERYAVKKLCQDYHMPYVSVETDYSESDTGQLVTRLSAFLEML